MLPYSLKLGNGIGIKGLLPQAGYAAQETVATSRITRWHEFRHLSSYGGCLKYLVCFNTLSVRFPVGK